MLRISHLTKTFHRFGHPPLTAVDDVSLEVPDSAAIGLVGESGSGKSTILRCLTRLETPDSGEIHLDDLDVLQARGAQLAALRQSVQMVFQDPNGSLNPRMTVHDLVAEGLLIHKRGLSAAERSERVRSLLVAVGLDPDDMDRRPGSFSGGQRQRIAIARALAVEPSLLVCDEPVSALDVSVRAQVLNVLLDMQQQLGLSLLFIAHDLAIVRHVCPYIYVLRHGRVVEQGTRKEIFDHPRHEYTRQLLAAIPDPDPTSPANLARRRVPASQPVKEPT